MSQDTFPKHEGDESVSRAEKIKIEAQSIPEFSQILSSLSDQEIIELDEHMRGTMRGENCTLRGFPGMYHRVDGKVSMDWPAFEALVEEWKNVKGDPDPKHMVANEQASLFNKRLPIVRKLAGMIDDA